MSGFSPPDLNHMPKLTSPQQKLDEERGIVTTPEDCIEGAVRLGICGPEWLVIQIRQVVMLTLDKMGFEIVVKVAKRYGDHERG